MFEYGTIGVNENLRVLREQGYRCMHMEFDPYRAGHVVIMAQKRHSHRASQSAL